MLTRFNRKTAAVLSGVTASLLVAFPASATQESPVVVFAEPLQNVRTAHVSYADLDLASFGGEDRLKRRVASAVKRVCLRSDSLGLQDSVYTDCAGGAMDGASPQIAQAVARAKEIALTGRSSIAAVAITIRAPAG